MGIKMIIGGDFFVTPQFTSTKIFSEDLISLFSQSDLNIINLESPVIDKDNTEKIVKTGPHLFTDNTVFKLLKQININAVTLANNHILDYGPKGIYSTLAGCQQNNITTTGAGANLAAASEPTIVEKKGLRIALINFCEHEFSVATAKSAGTNPLDLIDNLEKIKNARKLADFVLVIIHGGHEHYNLPSPRMIKQYRFFAENGADAVIGHHTHCISGFEIHHQIPIFYGLGNMLFTKHSSEIGWYNGLLVQFSAEKGSALKWDLIPIEQSNENFQLSLSKADNKSKTFADIEYYSEIIGDLEKLNNHWISFARRIAPQYLNVFSPIGIIPSRYMRALLRKIGCNKLLFRKKYLTPILNYTACESHHDLTQYILKQKIEKQ